MKIATRMFMLILLSRVIVSTSKEGDNVTFHVTH